MRTFASMQTANTLVPIVNTIAKLHRLVRWIVVRKVSLRLGIAGFMMRLIRGGLKILNLSFPGLIFLARTTRLLRSTETAWYFGQSTKNEMRKRACD